MQEIVSLREDYDCQLEIITNKFRQGTYITQKDGRLKFEPMRSRVTEIVLWPDCDQHYALIQMLLREYDNPYHFRWAMIIHDSDIHGQGNYIDDIIEDVEGSEDFIAGNDIQDPYNNKLKKPHIHLLIVFKEARTNTAIAKMFGIDSRHILLFHDYTSRLFYLVHRDRTDKFGYNPDHVIGPMGGLFLRNQLTFDSIDPYILYERLRNWLRSFSITEEISMQLYHDYLREIECGWFVTSKYEKSFYGELRNHNEIAMRINSKDNKKE